MPMLQPYLATGVAALGLLLMLLPGRAGQRRAGGGIALAGVAWLLVLAGSMPGDTDIGALAKEAAFIVFAAIALSGAVQMITQPRPVYAALFFVLVVLSTSGLLLLLEAYFIAFAVVIVYAGAILITYMFVLMLAQQASDADQVGDIPAYDRRRESPWPRPSWAPSWRWSSRVWCSPVWGRCHRRPRRPTDCRPRRPCSSRSLDNSIAPPPTPGSIRPMAPDISVTVDGDEVLVTVDGASAAVADRDLPGTTRHVGWDLVARFPASLEVAGVVLLMAMFGAVVLARRRIDLGEDALRASAGLASLTPEEPEEGSV